MSGLVDALDELLAAYFPMYITTETRSTAAGEVTVKIARRDLARQLAEVFPLPLQQQAQADADYAQIRSLRRAVCVLSDELLRRQLGVVLADEPSALAALELALADRLNALELGEDV